MRVLAALAIAALGLVSTPTRAETSASPGFGAAGAIAGAGAGNAAMQGAVLGSAAQKAKQSGSDSSKALEMMALAQMMQAQKDQENKKDNQDGEQKSKQDDDSKNKTVKWDLPTAVTTKFEIPQADDAEYRKQRAQATNAELESVRAGNDSTGLRSNEFVKLDSDPFVLGLGASAVGTASAANGGGVQVARPDSHPYDKAPIEDIRGAGTNGKPTKSDLVPIAGDLGGDARGAGGSFPMPQGMPGVNPFAPGSASPMVTGGNPLGSSSGDLAALGDGHGGNTSGGAGSGGGGGGGTGSRGIASEGGSRAGTLPIGSEGGGGGSGSSLNFGNFKSAEGGVAADGTPLYEGSSTPLARKESDINLFEYATYRLRKIAFNEKRVRTAKETLKALPPKQAGLLR